MLGDAPALLILSRALSVQDSARQATPIPSPADAPPAKAVDGVVAREMVTVTQRLFDNACFRWIDARPLLLLVGLGVQYEAGLLASSPVRCLAPPACPARRARGPVVRCAPHVNRSAGASRCEARSSHRAHEQPVIVPIASVTESVASRRKSGLP